ncbi:NAC domain-containing protein 83 [Linum perenne]
MEKTSFVKNGVLRLPPGFRFHPTDKEFVVQYLKLKVYPFPLQSSLMSMSASLILGICLIIHHPRKIPNWFR